MGPAARHLCALLWKNWLCRRRQPVLSLAELLWPCILFTILTVLRLQEPPRHRDTCYLQPRDLPSRGVFPFVQGLLCNTGSRCGNASDAGSAGPPLRPHAAADRAGKPDDLVFLHGVQDLAEELCDIMDKAADLQELWEERPKTPGSSYGSSFLTLDLSEAEEVIWKLETLLQHPHAWDLPLLTPGPHANTGPLDAGFRGAAHRPHAAWSSVTSLEGWDRLPLSPAFRRVAKCVLNGTNSTLMSLQEHGKGAYGHLQNFGCVTCVNNHGVKCCPRK